MLVNLRSDFKCPDVKILAFILNLTESEILYQWLTTHCLQGCVAAAVCFEVHLQVW